MAQVRRPPRYRSPPPRQIPALPNPIRVQLPTRNRIRAIPSNDPHHAAQSLPLTTTTTNQLSNTNLVSKMINQYSIDHFSISGRGINRSSSNPHR